MSCSKEMKLAKKIINKEEKKIKSIGWKAHKELIKLCKTVVTDVYDNGRRS